MAILFCERCGKETEWIYLGSEAVYCKSCGWQMGVDEFRAYRSRILREEFEKFLQRERERKNWMEELYDELEAEVQKNPKLAEEAHRRNMKQLEKLVNLARRGKKRRRQVLGVYPV